MAAPDVRAACDALAALADQSLSPRAFERALAQLIASVRAELHPVPELEDPSPRQKLFDAAGLNEGSSRFYAFARELDRYRDRLLAWWQSGSVDPVYCPYDCDRCHDADECVCINCRRHRGEPDDGSVHGAPDGTVYGIRPHLPTTPEEDAQRRAVMEAWMIDNPMTREQIEQIFGPSSDQEGRTP